MDADAATKDDIEDCSDGETTATSMRLPSATIVPPGVAGRFASYHTASHSDSNQRPDSTDVEVGHKAAQTFESDLDEWLGPQAQTEMGHVASRTNDDSTLEPIAEADTLLEELRVNGDGTFTGGPVNDDSFEGFLKEEPLKPASEVVGDGLAEEDDGSSDVELDVSMAGGAMPGTANEPPLPEEAWKDRPAAERELWERVRPRALRREAARVMQSKLPTATMTRLMRVHPELQTKSSEATEIINYATVLMLQAMAQATVRGRKAAGHTVRLEDIKHVCLNNRELHFLLPLSATLDASTLAMTRLGHDVDDRDEAATSRAAGNAKVVQAAPGQSTLSSSTFARSAGPNPVEMEPADGDELLDVVTVQGNLEFKQSTPQEKQVKKRKLPPSGKKVANKVQRQSEQDAKKVSEKAAANLGSGPGIASFFKRSENA